jgi:hypothetical protein
MTPSIQQSFKSKEKSNSIPSCVVNNGEQQVLLTGQNISVSAHIVGHLNCKIDVPFILFFWHPELQTTKHPSYFYHSFVLF